MADKNLTQSLNDTNAVLSPKISASILVKTYKDIFFDLIKSNQGDELVNLVMKDPVKFGFGIRALTVGLLTQKDWKNTERFASKPTHVQTHQELISDEIRIRYHLTINTKEYRKYFKDAGAHDAWIARQTQAISLSSGVDIKSMVRYLLGVPKAQLTKTLTAEVFKELDKLKAKIDAGRVITSPEANIISFIKTIREQSLTLAQTPAVNKMFNLNITNSDGDKIKLPVNLGVENQTLIMSWKDWNTFVNSQADVRNPEFYKLPEGLKVIKADIPTGKAFIIDKNLINFYPRLEGVVQRETDRMEMDSTTHIWFVVGIFPTTCGVIINQKA